MRPAEGMRISLPSRRRGSRGTVFRKLPGFSGHSAKIRPLFLTSGKAPPYNGRQIGKDCDEDSRQQPESDSEPAAVEGPCEEGLSKIPSEAQGQKDEAERSASRRAPVGSDAEPAL